MRVTGVIVRFLSLLDVTLCLLGILMLLFVQAQYRVGKRPVQATVVSLSELPTGFVPLYGGTYGDKEGRIFAIERDASGRYHLGHEILVGGEIDQLAKPLESQGKRVGVLILLSDRGFDRYWTDDKIRELSRRWGREVLVARNVRFPFEREE